MRFAVSATRYLLPDHCYLAPGQLVSDPAAFRLGAQCSDCVLLGAASHAYAMSDFKKLRVWHAAQQLALDSHRIANGLRGPGAVSLRDQLVRAAMSIPTNIVEGNAHESPRETLRFLGYALASTSEVEAHSRLAGSLEMISERDCRCLLDSVEAVRKMLYGFQKAVKARTK